MEPFEHAGVFFVPESPEPSPGDLSVSGESFVLRLDAPLQHVEHPEQCPGQEPRSMRLAVILGDLRDEGQVTLLNPVSAGHDGYQSWRASVALVGDYVVDPTFVRTAVEFDLLTAWTDPPHMVVWNKKNPLDGQVSLERTVLETGEFDGMKVELVSTAFGTGGHLVVDLRRRTWLVIDHEPMPIDHVNEKVVRPLKDLLVVLLGRSVKVVNLTVTPKSGGKPRRAMFREVVENEYLDYDPLWLRTWRSETLMTRKELPISFGEMLSGWFRNRPDLRAATGLLCSSFYASFMYADSWFASTFQAAEYLANMLVEPTEEQRATHKDKVDRAVAVLEAGDLPPDDLNWATQRIRSGTQPGLTAKVEALLRNAGPLGEQVLKADPKFSRRVASLRSSVAHPSALDEQSYTQMHWSELALRWIVRSRLLTQAGLPANAVVEAVDRRGALIGVLERLGRP